MMYHIIVGCLSLSMIAYIIPLSTLNIGARYFAMMLVPIACSKYTMQHSSASKLIMHHSWSSDHALQDS